MKAKGLLVGLMLIALSAVGLSVNMGAFTKD